MQTVRKAYLSPEEYLALERQAETKSEYFDGEVYAMTGASVAHNQIVANVVSTLNNRFKGGPCRVFASDMRVKVSQTELYTYPDVVLVCGRLQLEDKHRDTLLNPTVLIEVLSPSTEDYDLGTKFAHYRVLESLSDYLLIAQTGVLIEHYQRQSSDRWLLTTYRALDALVPIPSIGCDLLLTDVYDKVEWPEADGQPHKLRRVKEETESYVNLSS